MPVNKIVVSKNNLSITYNVFDGSFLGDLEFNVTLYGEGEKIASILDNNYFLFSPNYIENFETIEISKGRDIPTIPGVYNFTYDITSGDVTRTITILLNVINSDTTPPDVDYHLKYWLEYTNVGNDTFRLEINQKGYLDEPIEIHGRADLNYQDKKDLFQPIIASSLSIELEADEELSLNDLYSEDELMYQAVLKRNDQIIFIGFIKPDGIFENFVSNRWMLDIDAYDGLSTLKNLSFVSANGITYVGKLSVLEVIKNCLERTNLFLPINISCDVYYEGWVGYNILEDTFVNTERYYQDPKNIMDCEAVLKSILQIFNASIVQMNGEWWIYRSIDLKEETNFSHYIDGVYDYNFLYFPNAEIGSQINNFDIFHCNANQKKSIAASVQAYRIYYKYGNAINILMNGGLNYEGAGLNIPGWTVHEDGNQVWKLTDTSGLNSYLVPEKGGDVPLLTLNQSNIDVNKGDTAVLQVSYANKGMNATGLRFSFGIGGKWFNINDNKWVDEVYVNHVGSTMTGGVEQYRTYSLSVQAPIEGSIDIKIMRDRSRANAVLNDTFKLISVSVSPDSNSSVKGVYYTASRNSRVSTVTKENITVYNGDSNSDLFVGTLYKGDQETATEIWHRKDKIESLELLAINAEDNLRISPRPMLIFEGDIYGYIPYLCLLSIDNVSGKFQPIKYSYNTFDNQIILNSKEFSSEFLTLESFNVEKEVDYGNETKVTIK